MAKIWSAVTCHRFLRFGDLSPKPGSVQWPWEETGVVGCLAHHQNGALLAFDGDKSPAESADKSAHSKAGARLSRPQRRRNPKGFENLLE
jgi:hypothetical protein